MRQAFNSGFRDRTRGDWLALLLFGLIIAYQCFVPPNVGLADNGDFEKVLGVFGLGAPAESQYKFVHLKYDFDPKYRSWREFISTEQALAGIAILLNTPFSKQGAFDIRFLGLVHADLLILAFYLVQPLVRGVPPRSRVLLYFGLIAVFGDVMYVSWLNAAYMDTSALLFLFLSAVFYLRAVAWRRASDQLGFVVSAVLLTASKSAHCVLGLALAGLLLTSPNVFRGWVLRGIASGLIVMTMIVTLRFVPFDYKATGLYSVIFYALLPHSKNLSSDLRELGLDDSYRPSVGTYAYQEGNPFQDPQFVRQFAARASYFRLGLFLVRSPALAYRGIRYGLDFAGIQRPPLGNFSHDAGLAPGAQSKAFAVWSGLKAKILAHRGSVYVFYFLAICIALCGIVWRRRLDYFAGGVCLCLMALLALGIASYADAVEVTRHFFLFNALVDLILISALAALLAPPQKSAQNS